MKDVEAKSLLESFGRQSKLYRELLAEQEQKISLYLEGDLDRIEVSQEREDALLDKIRFQQGALAQQLQNVPLAEALEMLDQSDRTQLKRLVEDFRVVCEELHRVNLKNFRYLHTSLSFNQIMLKQMFGDSPNYTRDGYLKTNQLSQNRGIQY